MRSSGFCPQLEPFQAQVQWSWLFSLFLTFILVDNLDDIELLLSLFKSVFLIGFSLTTLSVEVIKRSDQSGWGRKKEGTIWCVFMCVCVRVRRRQTFQFCSSGLNCVIETLVSWWFGDKSQHCCNILITCALYTPWLFVFGGKASDHLGVRSVEPEYF